MTKFTAILPHTGIHPKLTLRPVPREGWGKVSRGFGGGLKLSPGEFGLALALEFQVIEVWHGPTLNLLRWFFSRPTQSRRNRVSPHGEH